MQRKQMFLVGLLFFVLIVAGGVLYLKHVGRETAEDLAGTQERMKPLTETQKSTTVRVREYEPTVEIDHEWASLTDEEQLQRNKEKNQAYIAGFANDPRYAELHKLMSENEYPYSPEVQAEIHAAYSRVREKRVAYHKAIAEIETKMDYPNLSGNEFVELLRERKKLQNRYKGGQ